MLKRLRQVRLRSRLIALAVLAAVLGAAPAWAYWTAGQPVTKTQTFNVGHLDITATPGSAAVLNVGPLYPGATEAAVVTVANAGSIPLSFYANGSAAGALGAALSIKVTNASTTSGTFPAMSCGGTQLAPSASSLPTAAPTPIAYATPAAGRTPLQPSGSTTICLQAGLPTSAADSLQGQTTTVSLRFVGDQVAQP